jgi:hypothetical protein
MNGRYVHTPLAALQIVVPRSSPALLAPITGLAA